MGAALIIISSQVFLAGSTGLMQLPDTFLIRAPGRSTSFHIVVTHSDLKGIGPMFDCKLYSRVQRVSYWCERQGEAKLFDLIFSFARLANSLPSMHDVKQHEYKVMRTRPFFLHFLLFSTLFPPIKTLSSKDDQPKGCTGTEHTSADKLGQERQWVRFCSITCLA